MTNTPMPVETLLLPTDGSDPAETAARRGLDLATQLDASVHLLSVADSALATGVGYAGDSASLRARLREQATARVESLQAVATRRGLETTAVVREGIPAKEIGDYAAEQNLDAIVLGTSGRGAVTRALVGSVADKLVRTAPVPVVTLTQAALENERGPVDSLLIPTDGSEPATAAATRGEQLAEQLGATIHYLSVTDETAIDGPVPDKSDIPSPEQRTAAAPTGETISATAIGDPATEIVEYANVNDIDLIVMGTQGHGGFQRAILGSVTDAVIRTADVPVVSVRAPRDTTAETEES